MYSNQPHFQNIQQINGTGHSIGAFVTTASAMCASAVVLWVSIAGFQSRRVRLQKELESDFDVSVEWNWFDRMIMFVFVDTWRSMCYKIKYRLRRALS